jgi:hypothetical protein
MEWCTYRTVGAEDDNHSVQFFILTCKLSSYVCVSYRQHKKIKHKEQEIRQYIHEVNIKGTVMQIRLHNNAGGSRNGNWRVNDFKNGYVEEIVKYVDIRPITNLTGRYICSVATKCGRYRWWRWWFWWWRWWSKNSYVAVGSVNGINLRVWKVNDDDNVML